LFVYFDASVETEHAMDHVSRPALMLLLQCPLWLWQLVLLPHQKQSTHPPPAEHKGVCSKQDHNGDTQPVTEREVISHGCLRLATVVLLLLLLLLLLLVLLR
jgi:hypothetical protein